MARAHGRFTQFYVSITSAGNAAPLLHTGTTNQNLSTDAVEVTAFGDTTKQYVVGLPDAQISFSGFASDAASTGLVAAALDGVARKWYFYPFALTTVYTYGTGFFDFTIDSDVAGAVKMSGNMRPASPVGTIGF